MAAECGIPNASQQVAAALANKLARIAWSVLRKEKAFDTHRHEVTAI